MGIDKKYVYSNRTQKNYHMENNTSTQTPDELTEQKKRQERLAACIKLAVNIESAFKLFSYRVLDVETFIDEVEKETDHWNKNMCFIDDL